MKRPRISTDSYEESDLCKWDDEPKESDASEKSVLTGKDAAGIFGELPGGKFVAYVS